MINIQLLKTIQKLTTVGKGLLAMDESNATCDKRFAALGIPQNPETRRNYRELIITTPGLSDYISGVILYDETVRQTLKDGRSFVQAINHAGIVPGIKVDMGAKKLAGFPGEKITEGLDGLATRIEEYGQMGARFAKWRAVFAIDQNIPTQGCITANSHALARYAAICQEAGLVPIVEPEVIMDGSHTLQKCFETTEVVLHALFDALYSQRVMLEYLILKPNMVLPGKDCLDQVEPNKVADATVKCLRGSVPAAVPCIAFLSGGQPCELASARLNAMNNQHSSKVPWVLTFSYSRAIQQPALEIWSGKETNREASQQSLLHRSECNSAARSGRYDAQMENQVHHQCKHE